MNGKQAGGLVLVSFLVLAVFAARYWYMSSPSPSPGASADPPGTPIRRSIERIHKNTTPQPGKFYSVGYQTYLKGVPVRDLFEVVPGKTELSERTARFTHVEPEETACLEYIYPSTIVGTLLGGAGLTALDYPVMNTTAHARHHVFYDADPDVAKGRDWSKVGDFQRGIEVAVYDLIDETDAIDVVGGVGVGSVVAVLRKSQRVDLPSGGSLDYAAFGERILAEFLFQAKPIPPLSPGGIEATVGGLLGSATAGTVPVVNSRFRDSGIWMTMAPGGPLPPPLPASPCPPPP